jgi:hypothetical protein
VQALEEADRAAGFPEEVIASRRTAREAEVEAQMLIDCEPFREHIAKFEAAAAAPKKATTNQRRQTGFARDMAAAVPRRGSLVGSSVSCGTSVMSIMPLSAQEKIATSELAKNAVRVLQARPSRAIFPVGFQAQFQEMCKLDTFSEEQEEDD